MVGLVRLDPPYVLPARFAPRNADLAAHLSTRYHPNTVRDLVQRAIPDMLDGRLMLWL